jgi:hypothetical protein
MVIYGDDSLNEASEEEEPSKLELEQRIKKEFGEPTNEQLRATGELDEADEELEDEPTEAIAEEQVNGSKLATVEATQGQADLSIRKQIEQGLLAGKSREDLIGEGYNKRSVQTVASELKTKGLVKSSTRALTQTKSGTQIFAKGSPPEAIIDGIEMPDVSNGGGKNFEQGMKFGMSVIVLATRLAQELTGIGMAQVKPTIEMARSMREGEVSAARNAAGEAAQEAAGRVQEQMMPFLASLSKNAGGGTGTDPMKAMMARQFEPIFGKMMQTMMGGLLPGTAEPQITTPGDNANASSWTHEEK